MIYENIVELSKKRNIPLYKIEKKARIANGTIGKWRGSSPNLDSLIAVARVLNVSVASLVGEEIVDSEIRGISEQRFAERTNNYVLVNKDYFWKMSDEFEKLISELASNKTNDIAGFMRRLQYLRNGFDLEKVISSSDRVRKSIFMTDEEIKKSAEPVNRFGGN